MNNAIAGIWTTHFLAFEWLTIHHLNQKQAHQKAHKKAHLKICSSWDTPYFRPEMFAPYPQISAPGFFFFSRIPSNSGLFIQVCVIFMYEKLTPFVWITHSLVWMPRFLVWTIHFLVWITNFLVSIPHFLIWITHSLVWNTYMNNSFPRMNNSFLCIWIGHILSPCTKNSYE